MSWLRNSLSLKLKTADIVRRASEKLGGRPSFDRAERQEQLERSGADFEELDRLFYDLDYCDRINDYILRNAEKVYFDGMAEVYD